MLLNGRKGRDPFSEAAATDKNLDSQASCVDCVLFFGLRLANETPLSAPVLSPLLNEYSIIPD